MCSQHSSAQWMPLCLPPGFSAQTDQSHVTEKELNSVQWDIFVVIDQWLLYSPKRAPTTRMVFVRYSHSLWGVVHILFPKQIQLKKECRLLPPLLLLCLSWHTLSLASNAHRRETVNLVIWVQTLDWTELQGVTVVSQGGSRPSLPAPREHLRLGTSFSQYYCQPCWLPVFSHIDHCFPSKSPAHDCGAFRLRSSNTGSLT